MGYSIGNSVSRKVALGLYCLAFALLIVLMVVHEALIWTPYTVYRPRLGDDEQREYAGTALMIQCLFTVVGMLLLLATAGTLSLGIGPTGLAIVILALVASAPFYLLREFIRRLLLARLDVGAVLAIDCLVVALQFSGFVLLYWFGLLSAVTACLVVGAACLLVSAPWLMISATRFAIRLDRLWAGLKRHWSFGRWICAGQLADVTDSYVLPWLLAVVVGTMATGVYAACSSLVLIFNPLILGIGGVLVPRAAQVYAHDGLLELRRVVWKVTVFLGAATSILCAGLAVFGEPALRLLYHHNEYAGHGHIITLLAVATLAGTISFAAGHGLWVLERPDINFKIRVAGLIVTVTTAVILVGTWGVLGAAIAGLLGSLVASAAQCAVFIHLTRRGNGPEDVTRAAELTER